MIQSDAAIRNKDGHDAEVLQIARSLQAQHGWYKQLFVVMITMLVLTIGSIVGLTTTLAKAKNVSNSKFDVADGSSSLVTINMESGEQNMVATDSYAHVHYIPYTEGAGYCASQEDVLAVQGEVLSGKLVIMEYRESEDSPLKIVQFVASGSVIMNEDGEACFQTLDGKQVCVTESEECKQADGRRFLQHGGGWYGHFLYNFPD